MAVSRTRKMHESHRLSYKDHQHVGGGHGDIHPPANFAKAVNRNDPLLPRTYLLRFSFTVPCEYWSMNEIILGLVSIEDREISIRKGLLGRCDGRIIECQVNQVDGQR